MAALPPAPTPPVATTPRARPSLALAPLALAVFASGAASLMYQVAWTRRLGVVTSATPAVQALVVGVFLAGLGAGAAWAGRRARNLPRPLLSYAAVELSASACAAASLPAIAAVGRGAPPWLTLVVSALVLLVTATLLGASLPFVLEHALRRIGVGATAFGDRTVGLLYGINTLGAVCGALGSGFVTVERYGLYATMWIGSALALVAVAIAASGGRRPLPALSREGASATGAATPTTVAATDAPRRLLLAAALAGLAGVGSEIVYTRLVALVVRNTVYVFAEVLAGVLVGIAAGGFVAAGLARGGKLRATRAVSAAALGLAAAAVLIASAPSFTIAMAGESGIFAGIASGSLASALYVVAIVAPPAALIGMALPLLVTPWRTSSSAGAFGALYAANTGGSVVGSLVAGFVLLPRTGLAVAVTAMALAALAAGAVLVLGRGSALAVARGRIEGLALAGAMVAVVGFHGSRDVPRDIYVAHVGEGLTVRDFREGTVSDVMVTEDPRGRRRLWINSAWVAGTGGGHRVLGHLPALFVAEPKHALGIALGTGQTFAAMFRHGFESLDCVEINPNVILLSDKWFGDANDHLFAKPGVRVHEDDGRAFLRATEQRFDLIVLEPLQAWTAGTSALYSREFYEEARRTLSPGGVVAQWIPFYGQTGEDTRAMVRAGAEVFPTASLWLDENDGILIMTDAPFALDPGVLGARAAARGVDVLLAENDVATPSDLLALFLLGPDAVRRFSAGAPLLDDDHPFLEFSAARHFMEPNSRRIFAAARDSAEDPSRYARAGAPADVAAAREARGVQLALLDAGMLSYEDHEGRVRAIERGLSGAPGSRLLSARYTKEIVGWTEVFGKDSQRTEEIEARAVAHDPKQGELMITLAERYAKRSRPDDARRLLQRAMEIPRTRAAAALALERMGPERK